MYENKIYLSLISHVTTTAVRTWLIFMCYDIQNHFIGNATDAIMNIITNRAKITATSSSIMPT